MRIGGRRVGRGRPVLNRNLEERPILNMHRVGLQRPKDNLYQTVRGDGGDAGARGTRSNGTENRRKDRGGLVGVGHGVQRTKLPLFNQVR